jgi:predicted nucleic acid-binding protein
LIAIDTSAFARYLAGLQDRFYFVLTDALRRGEAGLPPIVITELLSNPSLTPQQHDFIVRFPMMPLQDGIWQRAGLVRAELLRRGLKAHLADCLIAQSCIDNDAPLITYDRDFRHFKSAGLRVI